MTPIGASDGDTYVGRASSLATALGLLNDTPNSHVLDVEG